MIQLQHVYKLYGSLILIEVVALKAECTVSRVVSHVGHDVIIPIQHLTTCNRPMHLCRLPLDENGTARSDVTACQTEKCMAISRCEKGSEFRPVGEFIDRLGVVGDEEEELVSEVLRNVTEDDAGIYQLCNSWNQEPELALLVIRGDTSNPYIHSNGDAVVNSEYTLTCVITSHTLPTNHGLEMTYQWRVNGSHVTSSPEVNVTGSQLTLTPVQLNHDKMKISCLGQEEGGDWSQESASVVLKVEYGPEKLDMRIGEDDTGAINLTCSADCRPMCVLTVQSRGLHVQREGLGLVEIHLREPPFGTEVFACSARNKHDSINKELTFNPHQQNAEIVNITANWHPGDKHVFVENTSLHLSCNVIGRPEPTVQWYRIEGILKRKLVKTSVFRPAYSANHDNDVAYIYTSTYALTRINCSQSGRYVCEANNTRTSTVEKYFTIRVKCVPVIVEFNLGPIQLGAPLKLNLTVTSHTAPTVYCKPTLASTNQCGFNISVTSSRNDPIMYLVTLEQTLVGLGTVGTYKLYINNDMGTTERPFQLIATHLKENRSGRTMLILSVTLSLIAVACICGISIAVYFLTRRHRKITITDKA